MAFPSTPPSGASARSTDAPAPPGCATAILIADPHPVVRAGVRAVLADEPDMVVCGETGYGPEALDLATRLRPDVVVCDTALPGFDGLSSRLCGGGCKVLALTACEGPRTMREVLAAGARGYVLKRATTEQLVQAVRAVAAGGTYLDPELAGWAVDGFVGRDDEVQLSAREEQVLRQIAHGYSNKEIAAQLSVSVKTVETYKARFMDKLKVRSRVGIVEYAALRGWVGADPALVVG